MQTRALLNLDKKYCKLFLRAKQLPVKGLIDNRCHALKAVPERRAIHKSNAYFSYRKLRVNVNINRITYVSDSPQKSYIIKMKQWKIMLMEL